MIFINFYFIGLSASIGESLVISMEIKYRNHVKKENEWKYLTLSLVSYLILGNVKECCTVLVKNLIKESFYGKRKKSN